MDSYLTDSVAMKSCLSWKPSPNNANIIKYMSPVNKQILESLDLQHYSTHSEPYKYDKLMFKTKYKDPIFPVDIQNQRCFSASGRHTPLIACSSSFDEDEKVIYKIAVTTGNIENADTDAKVYMTIKGSTNTLPRFHLCRTSATLERTQSKFRFARGTTQVFVFTSKNVGNISSIIVEHDGLYKENSWYLEKIKIVKTKPGLKSNDEVYNFPCKSWLSMHKGDCSIKRKFYSKQALKTEYEVVLVTGSSEINESEVFIFLTIFGKTGQTTSMPLINCTNNVSPFSANQSDIFYLSAPCVGAINKIRIECEGKENFHWFLERAVITDLKNLTWKYYFPCAKWFSKKFGDGLIKRDLLGSRDPSTIRMLHSYKMTILTGSELDSGTSANVLFNIIGDMGDIGDRKIENNGKLFKKNSTYEMILKAPCLGNIQKIKISHDNKGENPSWLINQIIVDDLGRIDSDEGVGSDEGRVFLFPCNRWLKSPSGRPSIILKCGRIPLKDTSKIDTVPYKISLVTGDDSEKQLNSRVYIILHGVEYKKECYDSASSDSNSDHEEYKFKSSSKIWLFGAKLLKGTTDIFNVDVPGVAAPLDKITIGYYCESRNEKKSWFLKDVIVKCLLNDMEQKFKCSHNFSLSKALKNIEKDFNLKGEKVKNSSWNLQFKLSNGTFECNLNYIIYMLANKNLITASSKQIIKKQDSQFYECTNEIKGVPYKIRIWIDKFKEKKIKPFSISKIIMINTKNDNKYIFNGKPTFDFNSNCIFELPAEGNDIVTAQLMSYQVSTFTGDEQFAGTDAKVTVNIFGSLGDSGERILDRSMNNKNSFERGKMDSFKIKAVNLGKLQKLIIGHDGSGVAAGWLLNKVVISCEDDEEGVKEINFPCNNWLDNKKGDGLIIRELFPEHALEDDEKVFYKIFVKTGNETGAGTDANVHMKIFGKDDIQTALLQLRDSKTNSNKFEKGSTDEFEFEAKDVGKIEKIVIGHDGKKLGADWLLESVEIEIASKGKKYIFSYNDWIKATKNDNIAGIELLPTSIDKLSLKIPYEISIWTGSNKGSGTNANVFLQIYGHIGKTDEFILNNSKDNFKQGSCDKFKIEAEDIGQIIKIRIGHDDKGIASAWYLNKLLIKKSTNLTQNHKNIKSNVSKDFDAPFVSISNQNQSKLNNLNKNKDKFNLENNKHNKNINSETSDSSSESQEDIKSESNFRSHQRQNISKNKSHKEFDSKGRKKSLTKNNEDSDFEKLQKKNSYKGENNYDKKKMENNYKTSSSNTDSDSDQDKKRKDVNKFHNYDYFDSTRKNHHSHRSKYSDEEIYDHKKDNKPGRKYSNAKNQYNSSDNDENLNKSKSKNDRNSIYNKYNKEDEYEYEIGIKGNKDKNYNMQIKSKDKYNEKNISQKIAKNNDNNYQNKKRGNSISPFNKIKYKSDESELDTDYEHHKDQFLNHIDTKIIKSKSKFKKRDSSSSNERNKRFSKNYKSGISESAIYKSPKKLSDDSDDSSSDTSGKFSTKKDKLNKSNDNKTKLKRRTIIEEYWFYCDKWFDSSSGDKKIIREFLPMTEDGQPLTHGLEEVEYVVTVKTGEKSGAGTDSNVSIKITGDNGDSGDQKLLKSSNKNKFEENQVDVFAITCIDLGNLKKVKVWHDNKGFSSAWFLQHIQIEDTKYYKKYLFPCNRWLATDKDDGQLCRELLPAASSNRNSISKQEVLKNMEKLTKYHVSVFTGNKNLAGTDANVYIILYGNKDDTGKIQLKTSQNNNKFERNQMDKFLLEVASIGELKKIKIGHDNSNLGGDWYLEKVEIDCPSLGCRWIFPCNAWISKDKDEKTLERELRPDKNLTQFYKPWIHYILTTYTSKKDGSATEANIFVQLCGNNSETSKLFLCTNKNDCKEAFALGATKTFNIEVEDVGEDIEKLRVGRNEQRGGGWFLERIDLCCLNKNREGYIRFVFPCNEWISKEKGMIKELVHEEVFFEKEVSSGKIISKKINVNSTLQNKEYIVNVVTGKEKRCGTDANVFINIFGDLGETGERKLDQSETHKNKFENGQTDRFRIQARDLGQILHVKIRHDNSNLFPDWFLDKVEVCDTHTNQVFNFPCKQWLAKSKNDGKLERILNAEE